MSSNDSSSTEQHGFGKWIQQQRLQKNISLEEIAAVTKVHIAQLKHLENDERQYLPAPAFVRGFLISYARHLGLNEDEVLARFKEGQPDVGSGDLVGRTLRAAQPSVQSKVKLVESSTLGQAPAGKDLERPTPPILRTKTWLVMTGIVIVLVGLATLISIGKKSRKKDSSKPVAEESAKATEAAPPVPPPASVESAKTPQPSVPPTVPAVAVGPSAPATPSSATATVPKKFRMELRALEQSWVNVRVDDGDSNGQMLMPGNMPSFEADRKITLSLSDAGAVEIRWNGTWYAAPGFRGDVRSLNLPEQITKLSIKTATPVRKKAPPPATAATAPTPPAAATEAKLPGDQPAPTPED